MDTILAGALQQQGLDAGEAEFAFVTYGTEANAVVLNAFRIPGVTEVAMQQLAQLMSGADPAGEFEAETMEIGGKTVLSFSGEGQPGVVYFYVADDVAFTVAGAGHRPWSSSCFRSFPDEHARADRHLLQRGGGERAHRARQGHGRARSGCPRRRPPRHRHA